MILASLRSCVSLNTVSIRGSLVALATLPPTTCICTGGPRLKLFVAPEINTKFHELNWREKIRIAQGRNDPESEWLQDQSPQVIQRNRYLGVQPWDKSRIRLKVGEGMSDYINASPILLKDPTTGDETKYIATQVRCFRSALVGKLTFPLAGSQEIEHEPFLANDMAADR